MPLLGCIDQIYQQGIRFRLGEAIPRIRGVLAELLCRSATELIVFRIVSIGVQPFVIKRYSDSMGLFLKYPIRGLQGGIFPLEAFSEVLLPGTNERL